MESQWNERRSEPCGASAGGPGEERTALIGKKSEELTLVITHFFLSLSIFYFSSFSFSLLLFQLLVSSLLPKTLAKVVQRGFSLFLRVSV